MSPSLSPQLATPAQPEEEIVRNANKIDSLTPQSAQSQEQIQQQFENDPASVPQIGILLQKENEKGRTTVPLYFFTGDKETVTIGSDASQCDISLPDLEPNGKDDMSKKAFTFRYKNKESSAEELFLTSSNESPFELVNIKTKKSVTIYENTVCSLHAENELSFSQFKITFHNAPLKRQEQIKRQYESNPESVTQMGILIREKHCQEGDDSTTKTYPIHFFIRGKETVNIGTNVSECDICLPDQYKNDDTISPKAITMSFTTEPPQLRLTSNNICPIVLTNKLTKKSLEISREGKCMLHQNNEISFHPCFSIVFHNAPTPEHAQESAKLDLLLESSRKRAIGEVDHSIAILESALADLAAAKADIEKTEDMTYIEKVLKTRMPDLICIQKQMMTSEDKIKLSKKKARTKKNKIVLVVTVGLVMSAHVSLFGLQPYVCTYLILLGFLLAQNK